MRRFLALLLGVTLALVAVEAAAAKEPIEAKVTPMRSHLDRGETWKMTISFFVHGRPWQVQGLQPYVYIENQKTHYADFAYAYPTSRPGVFRASVSFPSKGKWSWSIGQAGPRAAKVHLVTIGPGGGSGIPVWPLVGGLAAACVPAGGAFAARRSRRGPST